LGRRQINFRDLTLSISFRAVRLHMPIESRGDIAALKKWVEVAKVSAARFSSDEKRAQPGARANGPERLWLS
jgi:hypothetical protein